MMSDSPRLDMTLLQAIDLFKTKAPGDWTPDELIAFRWRLDASPSLPAILGGRQQIDRRLAEVAAAHESAKDRPAIVPAAADEAPDAEPAVRPRSYRRAIEAALFLVLFGGAGVWLYSVLHGDRETPAAQVAATGKVQHPKSTAGGGDHAPAEKPNHPAPGDDTASREPADSHSVSDTTDDHTWTGWTVQAGDKAKWTTAKDWDLSDPSNARPAVRLSLTGGPLTLSRRWQIAPADHWLELNAVPVAAFRHAGHVVVRIGGVKVAESTIGTGESQWPVYVTLNEAAGKQVELEVAYEPGEATQQITWWGLAVVAERHKQPRYASPLVDRLSSSDVPTRMAAMKSAEIERDPYAVSAIIAALHAPEAEVRQEAAAALLRFEGPQARDGLRAALAEHADVALRIQIAGSFARRVVPADIGALNAALGSPDPKLRCAVLGTLAVLKDPRAVALLVKSLDDSDPTVCHSAAAGLVHHKDAAADAALLNALAKSPVPAVRAQAALHFHLAPNPAAIEPLIAAMRSDNKDLHRQSLIALSSIDDPRSTQALVPALTESEPSLRRAAAAALSGRKGPIVDAALLSALGTNPDMDVRVQVARHFSTRPNPAAVEPLLKAMHSDHRELHLSALRALCAVDDPRSTQALAGALNEGDPHVRQLVAASLAHRQDPAAETALLSALTTNPDKMVRRQAVLHCYLFPNPATIGPLTQAFHNNDAALRGQIAQALGRIGGDAAIGVLQIALKDSNPAVRKAAVEALKKMNHPKALTALKQNQTSQWPRRARALASSAVGRHSAT